jgi:carbon monoxide dehydrogenase subunit G
MAVVVVSTTVAANPDDVWARLRDFATWHAWLPRIVATSMDPDESGPGGRVGSVRSLELADGSLVRERLVAMDDRARTMSYGFDGSHPYPVRDYVGTVRVAALTSPAGTFVHWSGQFDVDAADEEQVRKTFSTVYGAFLDALAAAVTAR